MEKLRLVNLPSPHGYNRVQIPETVIIHSMARFIRHNGRDIFAPYWLYQCEVSAHFLIDTDGTIFQLRETTNPAWHASNFNTDSIGIEFLVDGIFPSNDIQIFYDRIATDGWYTRSQYLAGVSLVGQLNAQYPVTKILRHSDVDPTRKKDPGVGFPWEVFLGEVAQCR